MEPTVTEQLALVTERFPENTRERGTTGKVTIRWPAQPHPCHKVRFHNPARRSDSPTGIAETKEKLLKPTTTINTWKTRKLPKSQSNPEYSQPKFLPVQENILPYKRPDGYRTPADKKMHTALNIRQKGRILVQKCPTRCLYSSSNINIRVRPENESKSTIIK